MATFYADVSYGDVKHIEEELTRRRVGFNPDRYTSGAGYSQAFGVIRRWSYRPWVSRQCWLRPELWKMLQHFASNHVTIPWDAVQVNCNYESKPHKDKGNQGDSYIISFGEYTGGELVVDVSGEEKVIDTRLRGHHFNGSKLTHWNKPITSGTKFSLVFFRIEYPRFWPQEKGIPTTKVIGKDGVLWLHIEDCDGAIYEANAKNCVTIREPQVRLERVGKVNGFGGKAIVS
jgi:hypothetical protein